MNKEELQQEVQRMESATNDLAEPEKYFTKQKINRLKIEIAGLSASSIASKMAEINLSDIREMSANITAANNATEAQNQRVGYLNSAINFVKGALGIAL